MRWNRMMIGLGILLAGSTGGCQIVIGLKDSVLVEVDGTGGSGNTGDTGATSGSGGTGGTGMVCMPQETQSCYSGPEGTEGIGACTAGTQTCAVDGSGFEECKDEALPGTEDCAATGDEDCDGVPCSEPVFVQQFGDSAAQAGSAVAVDPTTGDIVVAGGFSSAIQIGDTVLTSNGASDVFVAKLSPKGEALWAKSFGDAKDQSAIAVAVAADSTILVAAANAGGIDLGGGFEADRIVIAKLTSMGNHKWTRGCGGDLSNALSAPRSMVVDVNGDILVAGVVTGTLDCGNGPLSVAGPFDAFAAKLTGETGVAQWSHVFGDAGGEVAYGIAPDAGGNAIVVGDFSDNIDFGNGQLTAIGSQDTFVAKLDPAGVAVWSKRFGDGGHTYARGVAVDSLGGPLVVGGFDQTVTFGDASSMLTSNGAVDLFAVKLNSTGGYAWSTRLGDALDVLPTTIATAFDENGDFLVAGSFEGVLELGGQEFASDAIDVFVTKIDSATGMFRWARQGTGVGGAFLKGIKVGKSHQIALTGSFDGTLDFGTGPLTTAGGTDAFLALLWP